MWFQLTKPLISQNQNKEQQTYSPLSSSPSDNFVNDRQNCDFRHLLLLLLLFCLLLQVRAGVGRGAGTCHWRWVAAVNATTTWNGRHDLGLHFELLQLHRFHRVPGARSTMRAGSGVRAGNLFGEKKTWAPVVRRKRKCLPLELSKTYTFKGKEESL